MVIVSYSPKNFKFLSNTYLENLSILPSFIYGINTELSNIKNDLTSIIKNLYVNKYDLNKDIIINNIYLKYLYNTTKIISNNITKKLKQNVSILGENASYYKTIKINLPNYLLSDTIITNLINNYKYLVIINCNYIDKNNYDIINILFVICKYPSDPNEKKIFEIKNIEFTEIII